MSRSFSESVERRAIMHAEIMIINQCTIRGLAEISGVSRSVIQRDFEKVLPRVNTVLWQGVRDVLNLNKKERATRGGKARQEKFARPRVEIEVGKIQ